MTATLPDWVADIPENLSEDQYHQLWTTHVPFDASPYDKAVAGGYCADQPAWIFIGGYQGAIAHTFPDQTFAGWTAFAISEDRSEDKPLPGLTSVDGEHLNGYKTWIATSRNAGDLIVSYRERSQKRSEFSRFGVDCPGLTITHKTSPSMLPDLSQGVAHFDEVRLADGVSVESARVSQFGRIEGFYVLVAMLACLRRRFDIDAEIESSLMQEVQHLLTQSRQISSQLEDQSLTGNFKQACRDVLREVRATALGQSPVWQRDGKLLAGYAR